LTLEDNIKDDFDYEHVKRTKLFFFGHFFLIQGTHTRRKKLGGIHTYTHTHTHTHTHTQQGDLVNISFFSKYGQ
jgi:hypothetical protein